MNDLPKAHPAGGVATQKGINSRLGRVLYFGDCARNGFANHSDTCYSLRI
jgi:hypothetical protein